MFLHLLTGDERTRKLFENRSSFTEQEAQNMRVLTSLLQRNIICNIHKLTNGETRVNLETSLSTWKHHI